MTKKIEKFKHIQTSIWHASLRLIGLKINLFRQSIRHHSMTVFMTQSIMNHDACLNSGLSELPPPQILVDQLTLSQPEREGGGKIMPQISSPL